MSFDPRDGAGVSQHDVIPKEAESPVTFPLHNGNNLIGPSAVTPHEMILHKRAKQFFQSVVKARWKLPLAFGPEESLVLDITHHYAFFFC